MAANKNLYNTILARSFSKYEQKKLGYGALVASFLLTLSLCTIFKPYLVPLSVDHNGHVSQSAEEMDLRLQMGIAQKMMAMNDKISRNRANIQSETLQSVNEAMNISSIDEVLAVNNHRILLVVNETGTSDIVRLEPVRNNTIVQLEPSRNSTSDLVRLEPIRNNTIIQLEPTRNSTNDIVQLEPTRNSTNDTVRLEPVPNNTIVQLEPTRNSTSDIVQLKPICNSTGDVIQLEPIRNDTSTSQNIVTYVQVVNKTEHMCNVEGSKTDYCEIINHDVRIDGNSANVLVCSSDYQTENSSWKIKPYARKGDVAAMNNVRQWTVKKTDQLQICAQTHNVPAIIFSNGGYSGNNFHDFTDVIIPLYLTARQFNGEVKFLITDRRDFWTLKFAGVVKSLSNYEIIDVDNEESTIHCFKSVIIGLKRPHGDKELTIDPLKSPHSMRDFRNFLRSAYSLKRNKSIKLRDGSRKKPQLLIVARKRTRAFTNTGPIAKMAKSLGFRVIVSELGMNLNKTAQIVNSCDIMLGVHGAGLTNLVFLPANAILIQVVPFGGFEWLAKFDFEEPSKDMDLRYLEYKIGVQESTLIQQYPPNDVVLTDPGVVSRKGWEAFATTYLKQNVNVDIDRLRGTLVKALELLHK